MTTATPRHAWDDPRWDGTIPAPRTHTPRTHHDTLDYLHRIATATPGTPEAAGHNTVRWDKAAADLALIAAALLSGELCEAGARLDDLTEAWLPGGMGDDE